MPLRCRIPAGIVTLFLLASGCGYNPKESTNRSAAQGFKGTVECLYSGCHDSEALSWALGSHANLNAYPGSADDSCADCHDPIGDSADSALIFTSANGVIDDSVLAALGLSPRHIVGCEGCHGSGMAHYAYVDSTLYYGGHREPLPSTLWAVFGNAFHIASCGPCHSPDQHAGGASPDFILANQYSEWWGNDGPGFSYDSGHSDSLVVETSQGLMTGAVRGVPCAACHTVEGFAAWFAGGDVSWGASQSFIDRLVSETGGVKDLSDPPSLPGAGALPQVSCVACHPSHEPGVLLRGVSGAVSGTERRANLCMACHNVRGLESAEGSGQSGIDTLEIPRHPQREMFLGYGDPAADGLRGVETLPGCSGTESAHAGTEGIPGGCTGCHYVVVDEVDSGELPKKATTGHTFQPRLENCLTAGCHTMDDFLIAGGEAASYEDSTIAAFDFGSVYYSGGAHPGRDHDGDGTVEPLQEEIGGLLEELKLKLTARGVPFDRSQGVFDLGVMAANTTTERAAAYNYDFAAQDGSLGYHNPIYAARLLAASISALP